MMRRLVSIFLAVLLGLLPSLGGAPAWAFTQRGIYTATASVTVGASTAQQLTIQATALPLSAFFGKNVVIPVKVTGNSPINLQTLTLDMEYQLSPSSQVSDVPISLAPDPANSFAALGTAIIPAANLEAIRHGGSLYYIFVARQGGAGTMLNSGGMAPAPGSFESLASTASFATTIDNTICSPVGPSGARVSAPDLFENDGQTSVFLGPGAISGMGTLCITQGNPSDFPSGPGGGKAVSVYTITLDGAALTGSVPLALSYPSDTRGNVLGTNLNPNDLAILWLGPENVPLADQQWYVLSRANIDTTLHTVTGTTSHFSNFALFAPGAASAAAATRPATRIITPNGNTPRLVFASDVDEVRIFDIKGRRIKTIHGPSPVWDATDTSGRIVESGVYIYQYTSQGERVSGVIAVAK